MEVKTCDLVTFENTLKNCFKMWLGTDDMLVWNFCNLQQSSVTKINSGWHLVIHSHLVRAEILVFLVSWFW